MAVEMKISESKTTEKWVCFSR